ncbi:deoxyribose-phosphate aldolase [Gelria sp. Kuro-4]|uniref:deoxyribose-phosphate aldolase n=1 Tax=Gelria sp. Kuro-4 TaxID=2796927 RepID=UPI001BED9177|nr:deoxyribose-phosphate aldolase [Gelria sp. Kuro-4]BCV24648.1 deoxyribose-phosphate aldolase [Gelria sp. Kuro-4]
MQLKELARMIDHTLLKPTATPAAIRALCQEAKEHGFGAVCVQPCYVKLAEEELKETAVKVATVIGFPLGVTTSLVKAAEAGEAVANGADELDMVLNIGAVKAGGWDRVENDIRAVVQAAGTALVKVILETCYLTDEEIVRACQAAVAAGAGFVKTSTGFGPAGAKPEHVRLMRQTVGPNIGVKAAGGIRTFRDAQAMIEAGATRLGASSGVQIIKEAEEAGIH